jgi:hypothetical protein
MKTAVIFDEYGRLKRLTFTIQWHKESYIPHNDFAIMPAFRDRANPT